MQFGSRRRITSARVGFSVYSHATRPLSAQPSRSRLVLLLSLMVLAGLAGCGPGASDRAPSQESRTSAGGPVARGTEEEGKKGMPPIDAGNETALTSGKGKVTGGNHIGPADKLATTADAPNVEPNGRDKLSVSGMPESIAKSLHSPDPRERLWALNHWGAKDTKAPLDPVFEALEDENESVRAKATALVEQSWTQEQERKR